MDEMLKKQLQVIAILMTVWIANTFDTGILQGKSSISCRLDPFSIAEKAKDADIVDINSNDVLWKESKEDEDEIPVYTLYYWNSQSKKTTVLYEGRDFLYAKIKNGMVAAVFRIIEMNEEGRNIHDVLKIRTMESDSAWQTIYESKIRYNQIYTVEIQGTQKDPLIYFYDANWDIEEASFTKMLRWNKATGVKTLNDEKSYKYYMVFLGEKIFFADDRTGDLDIWVFDTKTEQARPIVQAPGDQFFSYDWESSEVVGTRFIVWLDSLHEDENEHYNYDIYGTDLASEKTFPIATSVNREDNPVVIGNTVYWLDTYFPPGIDNKKIVPITKVMSLDYQTGLIKEMMTPKTYKTDLFANPGYLIWNEEVYSSIRKELTTDIRAYSFIMNACFSVCISEMEETVLYMNRNHIIWMTSQNGLYDPMNILSSDLILSL